jgi:membrane fusion protein, multidrug efflux system
MATSPLPETTRLKLHKTTPPQPAPRRPWLLWIFAVVTLAVIAYAIFLRPSEKAAGQGRWGRDNNRPMPVTAEPARKTDLDVRTVALGTVTPVNSVVVRSRVDGELRKIFFEEGKTVEAGAPLAEIDPRPFEVQKLQSEAQLAKDQALLENARLDLERFQTLLDQDSVAKQQVDTQAALVRQYEAAIKLDQAQLKARRFSSATRTSPHPSPAGSACASSTRATWSILPMQTASRSSPNCVRSPYSFPFRRTMSPRS